MIADGMALQYQVISNYCIVATYILEDNTKKEPSSRIIFVYIDINLFLFFSHRFSSFPITSLRSSRPEDRCPSTGARQESNIGLLPGY